jgi:hypothetical protein
VALIGNTALGAGNYDGVGGAIALDERCVDGSQCAPVTAQLRMLNMTGNSAQAAGGAIFLNGSSPTGGLMLRCVECLWMGGWEGGWEVCEL